MSFRGHLNRLLRPTGYQISKYAPEPDTSEGYTLHTFLKPDGSFDYGKYKAIQTRGNRRKITRSWAREADIDFLARYVRERLGTPRFGLCHGTRRGDEQRWFSERLRCDVLGTEISDTATRFPNTIQWDFHDVKPEWIDRADFVYSNAFDHTYDPEKCLDAWMSCVRPGGLCLLEHSSAHEPSGRSLRDPFGAELVLMPYFITKWGKGRYGVREILPAPEKREGMGYSCFIAIQRF